MDIRNINSVHRAIDKVRPDIVINAAAYTAVDKAQQEPELAYAVNRDGAAYIAQSVAQSGARLIHISTDYVFDGTQGRPYNPDDSPNPQCVYGASKLAGEQAVSESLSSERALIIRTSWVYSAHGKNFVKTMLRFMAERDQLRIVADQIGSPTWAQGLAKAIWRAVTANLFGIYHWSDAGVASWYDFAVAIQEEALQMKLLKKAIQINPISTHDYPLPAKRPGFCVLNKTDTWKDLDISPRHWRESLRLMLKETRVAKNGGD
jgi:dTDP-4-dehydrorhamnose reductase